MTQTSKKKSKSLRLELQTRRKMTKDQIIKGLTERLTIEQSSYRQVSYLLNTEKAVNAYRLITIDQLTNCKNITDKLNNLLSNQYKRLKFLSWSLLIVLSLAINLGVL